MQYLTFIQTLKKLKDIPKSYQPQGIAQLSNACMNGRITPVFQYNAYSLTYAAGTGDNAEYINIPIRGYLTHQNLSNVFNWSTHREKKIEFTEAVIYELTQEEEQAAKGDSIVLAKKTFHHLRPQGNARSFSFDVQAKGYVNLYSISDERDAERIRELGGVEISQNDLLFPTEQVEEYLDSFIFGNEESYINSVAFNNSDDNSNLELQKQEIEILEARLMQANDDNEKIKEQLVKANAELVAIKTIQVDHDKDLNPKSHNSVTRILNVLFHKAELDINAYQGTTNKNIVDTSISLNAKITEKPVLYWIKQVQQLRINIQESNN